MNRIVHPVLMWLAFSPRLIQIPVLLWLGSLPFFAGAQFHFNRLARVAMAQGLPAEDIRALSKDGNGFLWIATSRGLCRFDGSELTRYSMIDSAGNGSNDVYSVVAAHGRIWAGTTRGLLSLNEKTGTVEHHRLRTGQSPDVLVLQSDSAGLWIGARNKGFWYYNLRRDTLFRYDWNDRDIPPVKPLLGGERRVLSFEFSATNDSIVWIGTTAGLISFNRYSEQMKWYVFPSEDPAMQVGINSFRRLYSHTNGKLYVGSWTAGVHEFDPETGILNPLVAARADADRILKSAVGKICPHRDDQIWISCGSGLILYDIGQRRVVSAWENDQAGEEFYGADLVDEQGRIWHFNVNGLQYFDPMRSQFPVFSYAHLFGRNWAFTFNIIEGKDSTLIVGPRNGGGLYVFSRKNSTWKSIPLNLPGNTTPLIRGMITWGNGVAVSTDEGLFEAGEGMPTRRIMLPYRSMLKRYNEIMKDKSGRIWLALDEEGLLRWEPEKGRAFLFAHEGLIRDLFCDRDNGVWFSSDSAIHRYSSVDGSFIHYKLLSRKGFSEDEQGRVWVGLNGKEVCFIDRKNDPDKLVRVSLNGLGPDAEIRDLATDPSGLLWGYTDEYLFSWDHDRRDFRKFPMQYGAARADFYHMSFLRSGELLLGGRSRIFLMDPRKLKKNSEVPRPYLTRVEVFEQGRRKSAAIERGSLDLSYRENSLSIYFSALAFTFGESVKFRYRLKGLDDWTETNDRRSVNYSSLRGGDYTFQLMAANNEGQWSAQVIELPFRIRTPWWRSGWFYLLLAGGFSLGLYAWYRTRLNAIRRKEMLKTEYEKKLANVEMSALLAQMNPHFLFNSLNSIDSYIIRNESGKASEYLNNFARLIRRILHNSRSGMVSLKDEIETLDLYLQMESLRFRDRFEFSIDVEEGLDREAIRIPPLLIQPYVENAIWHGIMHCDNRSRGRVQISISMKGEALHCVVRDNGIGRKKAMELAAHSQGPKKSSMGMQITRERIDMINKLYNRTTSVTITDLVDAEQQPAGTEVHLVIPLT